MVVLSRCASLPPPRRLCFCLGLFVGLWFCLFVNKITQKLIDRFWWNFQDMYETVKGRNDSILGAIRITIWIFWIHDRIKTDNSKSYGWILMKFSGYVLNGTRNNWLDFGSDMDHSLDSWKINWEWSGSLSVKIWNRGGKSNISANGRFWKSRNWAPVAEVCALQVLLFSNILENVSPAHACYISLERQWNSSSVWIYCIKIHQEAREKEIIEMWIWVL